MFWTCNDNTASQIKPHGSRLTRQIPNSKVSGTFFKGMGPEVSFVAEIKAFSILQELTDMKGTTYSAGGATQNSIRFAQWILQKSGATSYMGCVGKDKFADILKQTMDKAGCAVSACCPCFIAMPFMQQMLPRTSPVCKLVSQQNQKF